MKYVIQKIILICYNLVRISGILATRPGKRLSNWAYLIYKNLFENSFDFLANYVRPGTSIIDVGANVGFFSMGAIKWLTGEANIFAIEPENNNFELLKENLSRGPFSKRFNPILGAAADIDGVLLLEVNEQNPADHKIGVSGRPVPAFRLDTMMAEHGWPPISLIKIDVQGAELRVLKGASKIIEKFSPAIYLELDNRALAASGLNSNSIIDFMKQYGYDIYSAKSAKEGRPIALSDVAKIQGNLGYADFLFLRY